MREYIKKIKRKIRYLTYNSKEKRHYMVGPPHLWKMKREFQINFLKAQKLKPEHVFLDIGCGTLRGGIPIISYLNSGNYYGIEVREDVLNEGKKELLEEEDLKDKNPVLLHFDDFDYLKISSKFDIILAYSVLIHMDDQIVEKCFDFVSKHLQPDGHFYANVNIEKYKDAKWQGFPVVFRSIEFYMDIAGRYGLQTENLGTLDSLGHYSNQEAGDKQLMLKFKLTK